MKGEKEKCRERKKEANLMKNLFKKIGALLVAAVMVLSMCTAVFADESAKITVTNADKATLKYAQVIVPYPAKTTGWEFVNTDVAEAYINAFKGGTAQATIQMMIDQLKANNVNASALSVAQANAASHVTFGNMEKPQTVTSAGIYLIKAEETGYTYNLMSAYVGFGGVEGNTYPALQDATVEAKKTEIKVDKITTDSDNVTHTGDILTYRITTNVPYIAPTDTSKTFWVYDELTGATYNKDAKIKLGNVDVTKNYSFNYDKNSEKFSVDLSRMINPANSNANTLVTIEYTVTVTSNNDKITNNASAGHEGGKQYGSTPPIEIYEGNITLTKTNEDGSVKLANAGFEVRKDTKDSAALNFKELEDGVYMYVPEAKAGETTTEVFTKADGTVKVQGLDVGKYYFKEITAPERYSVNQNQSEATLAVVGGDKATATLTATTDMTDTKLSALPHTGGMGTYLFTIIGVVVMAGAAGAFFISRRKGSEE